MDFLLIEILSACLPCSWLWGDPQGRWVWQEDPGQWWVSAFFLYFLLFFVRIWSFAHLAPKLFQCFVIIQPNIRTYDNECCDRTHDIHSDQYSHNTSWYSESKLDGIYFSSVIQRFAFWTSLLKISKYAVLSVLCCRRKASSVCLYFLVFLGQMEETQQKPVFGGSAATLPVC